MIPIMPVPVAMPFEVPLYSQISNISSPAWKQKGCGIADLAMIIEFYKPKTTSVDEILEQAIRDGAYVKNVGWSHAGLAALVVKYGLVGSTYDLTKFDKKAAYNEFKKTVEEGPVVASIHRGFDPKSPYGHLIVVTGFDDDLIYYNDPGKKDGKRKVAITDFVSGWKKRLIVIRPPETQTQVASAR